MKDDNDFSAEPLSDAEIQTIRRMMRDDSHMRWFWATARIWFVWVSGAIAALYASWDVLVRVIKTAFAK